MKIRKTSLFFYQVYETSSRGGPDVLGMQQFTLPVLAMPLGSMPQDLHASICDLLDVPHALSNDWTALAGTHTHTHAHTHTHTHHTHTHTYTHTHTHTHSHMR